ncbi:MAG: 4-diphosphocytidyl-2-C-methyl-D-erythritol kinase [Planctomycetota bacterium]
MSDRTALYLPSRAKLNLVLRIVGRRDDGYHLLESLFHTLDLCDDVVVEHDLQSGGVGITVTADHDRLLVPADDSNLAVKALILVREELGDRAQGAFQIRLHKRIPNGGGLGGGSSNAAAVLRLSNRLLGNAIAENRLQELGTKLGADVPFFLRGGSQWGSGIGTELHPAAPVQSRFVLLIPPYGCGTVEVYKKHAALWRGDQAAATVKSITVPDNWDSAVGIGFSNELEEAAEQVRPELGRLRHAVAEAGYALTRMSGSGSTLFVAVPDAESAQQCQRHLTSALAQTEHREVSFVQTRSGPAIDVDQPSSQIPATLRHPPPDPLC